MKAHWTRKGLRRLQEIHDYIAQDQPVNAARFVDRLTRRADRIAEQRAAAASFRSFNVTTFAR